MISKHEFRNRSPAQPLAPHGQVRSRCSVNDWDEKVVGKEIQAYVNVLPSSSAFSKALEQVC